MNFDEYDDYDDIAGDDDAMLADLVLDEYGRVVAGDPEEVGRLLSRRQRRRRNAAAMLLGGPAALALAKRRQRRAQQRHDERLLAASAALTQPAPTAAPISPSDRRLMLPFQLATFEPGGTAVLTTEVEKGMRPDRLVIYSTAPQGTVVVQDLKLGVDSQLGAVGVMPIEAFRAEADLGFLQLDPVRTGNKITIPLLSLEPTTPTPGAPRRYTASAVMYGMATER